MRLFFSILECLISVELYILIITCRTQKNPDDIVITLALRTPMAKGFKGGFKDTDLDYLVLQLLQEVMAQSKLDPNLIDDVLMGNVRI